MELTVDQHIDERRAREYLATYRTGRTRSIRDAAGESLVAMVGWVRTDERDQRRQHVKHLTAEQAQLRKELAEAIDERDGRIAELQTALRVMLGMRGVCPSCRRAIQSGPTQEMTHVHAIDCAAALALREG